jgi:hypothetical protein
LFYEDSGILVGRGVQEEKSQVRLLGHGVCLATKNSPKTKSENFQDQESVIVICVILVQENTLDSFGKLFCLFDFYHLMFVIVMLSLFHVADVKLSLLCEDSQDLFEGPLEELNNEELFEESQLSPWKNTSEEP